MTRLATEVFFEAHGLRLAPRMTLGSNEAVKHAIAAGLGVAVLSRHAPGSEPARDGLALLNVTGLPLRRTWKLARRSDRTLPLAASAFLAFVKEKVRRGEFDSAVSLSQRPLKAETAPKGAV